MGIGNNIKKWREFRNLKQTELAEMIGVSDKTVSSWEINRTEPKMGMVEKICAALNCKKTDIIGENIAEETDIECFNIQMGKSNSLYRSLAYQEAMNEVYYLDEDARNLAQFMFENPEYKVLFDASRKVKKEDIEFVKQMIDRVRGDDNDTGC